MRTGRAKNIETTWKMHEGLRMSINCRIAQMDGGDFILGAIGSKQEWRIEGRQIAGWTMEIRLQRPLRCNVNVDTWAIRSLLGRFNGYRAMEVIDD